MIAAVEGQLSGEGVQQGQAMRRASGEGTAAAAPYEDPPLAVLGALDVRLAHTPAAIEAAQRLRHAVFCDELGLDLPGADEARGLERDAFDAACDHIIVIDTTPGAGGRVVGTYRALRPERAGPEGLYTQGEFDIAPLLERHAALRFCEIGRSCVAASHRSLGVLDALWCGLWAYAARHRIDVYFGAASFPGTDPAAHAMALSYLFHRVGAPEAWRVGTPPGAGTAMDLLPPDAISRKEALRAMPPLVRGYLKVNAHIGARAYIDRQFETVDVLVLARLALMPEAYRRHFERVTGRGLAARAGTVGIGSDLP